MKKKGKKEEKEKKENWMIIALTATIIGTFNVLTGVTKALCPIKCRCGICAVSWSSLDPTARCRAFSVWSPLWPVTVHWIRFCERKRLKPKYQASLVVVVGGGGMAGLGERRFEIWDLRFDEGGGGREQSCSPLALSPFCISLRPTPNHPHPRPNKFGAIHTPFTRSG